MGLRDTTMKNGSVSDNYLNHLLYIASTILFLLILVTCQRKYLPLMRPMKEIQFILVLYFIFPVVFILCSVHHYLRHTLNSDSSISYTFVTSTIVSQNITERGEAIEEYRYNSITRRYCSGRLTNVNIGLKRSLQFCKG